MELAQSVDKVLVARRQCEGQEQERRGKSKGSLRRRSRGAVKLAAGAELGSKLQQEQHEQQHQIDTHM